MGKFVGFGLAGLALLAVVALALVWALVDPNAYKPRIVAAVKSATGRELVLQGDLKLSVFPWIALELGPASLGNPPGFPNQPFLSFQHAAVRVRLPDLFMGRVEVGHIEIDGLRVRLLENAAGVGNWQGLQGPTASAAPPAGRNSGAAVLAGLSGVRITQASLSYRSFTLSDVSLEAGSFAGHGVVPVTVHAVVNRGIPGESANLELRVDVEPDLPDSRYTLAALNLNGLVTRPGQARPIRWVLTAPVLGVDLAAQSVSAPMFTLEVAGAQLAGSLDAERLFGTPRAAGRLTLAPVLVREYLPRLGLTAPVTRDPKALKSVSAALAYGYEGGVLRLDDIKAVLDDTHVTGRATLDQSTRAFDATLALDRLDVDRYLAPPEPARAPLPIELRNVRATLAAHAGVLQVFPLKADIDGGAYSGDIALDRRGTVPVLSVDEHLVGIDMATLLPSAAHRAHVTGRGTLNLKATGHGTNSAQVLSSLDGHVDLAVANGALQGVDLGYDLARAEALFDRRAAPPAPSVPATPFEVLKLSATITDGVAHSSDVALSSSVLSITGKGSATLASQALDFELLADTRRSLAGAPIAVPLSVTGTFSDPVIRPNVAALVRGSLTQKLKDLFGR